jgi:hypothetical protein
VEWLEAADYGAARWLVSRGIALIYLIAFANVIAQWRPLLGTHGLLPVPEFIRRVPARAAPSVFQRWYSDGLAVGLAWLGAGVSASLVVGIPQQGPSWLSLLAFAVLWVLYLSYVNVGQLWYGFGWESILLDAGAIALLLGSDAAAPTWPVVLMLRWLVFRIEFGAGLIKLRGDPCWRDLTCLDYHHETQPLPGPLSWFFHHLPRAAHRAETGTNHVVQLVLPFGLFLPQPVAGIAALAIVVTQSWLVVSGNFAWLNAVTIVLAFSGFSDGWLDGLPLPDGAFLTRGAGTPTWLSVLSVAAFVATVWASRKPVANMWSPGQRMNASFNPFHLVGTYGAFGSVTKARYEVELEGTLDPEPGPESEWRTYGFTGKPGDPQRRPPQIAPYHLRLDWLMWFLAMSAAPGPHRRWFGRLLEGLLEADPAVLGLLRHDPFGGERPTAVRARRYRYRYTTRAERRETGAWWHRDLVGEFAGPVHRSA